MKRKKKQVSKYRWAVGCGMARKVKLTEVVKTFQRHETSFGRIVPRALVDEAKPKDAPLHNAFEWRDGVAADKYRLQQAQLLIRSVVEIPSGGDGNDYIRSYVVVQKDKEEDGVGKRGYISISNALLDANKREYILEQAKREFTAFRYKYRMFKEVVNFIRPLLDTW